MVEAVAVSAIEQLISEYVRRIVEKAMAGKRLSDWEMGILMMDHMRSSLEAKIEMTRKDLEAKIETVRSDLEVAKSELGAKISSIETKISSIEKRVEKVESDIDYMKKSLDSLRDNVINVLVAELKRRMEQE
ncbi:MAG: hypothetical protein C0200_01650 [Thermoproteota archaeon]|nr:MAG: hypothetical protein C0200_01650 [Candidatus Korarchaeota archaeon]